MRERASNAKVRLRPHVKTHKTIEGALLQTGGIKSKIVCSTLAEVRHFSSAGFQDILYGVLIEPIKLKRINEEFPDLILLVDSLDHILLLEQSAIPRRVFLKVDTGYHRAGASLGEPILKITKAILESRCPLTLLGLYSHSGHTYNNENISPIVDVDHNNILKSAHEIRETLGYDVPVIAVGSTPHCSITTSYPNGITEIHPGNYLFYDRQQQSYHSCREDEIACTIGCRVIGRYPERNQLLIDVGSLALSKDQCTLGGYGGFVGYSNLMLVKISQESGIVEPFEDIPIGTFLQIYPNHSCLAAACYSKYYVHDENGVIVDEWVPCREW
jgi:D-serine ammonia-lyase